jgi:undecaprenyl-diphosphatase
MTDLLSALLLGIIEGITEFLPISSTGHLLIAEHWLGRALGPVQHRHPGRRDPRGGGDLPAAAVAAAAGLAQKSNRDYALKLALAFAITGALGLLVKKLGFQLPETLGPVAWALLLGGFVILAVEAIDARRSDLPDTDPDAIGWGTAALVGLAQVLAGVFPGTSRSAAAIFAALLFGRSSRVAATEFAFLVGIPTMFAATGYELLHTLKDGGAASEDWSALAVAFVVSALTAFAAVKWLLRYIQTHRFTVFAWYRIVLGAALLAWLGLAPASLPGAAAAPDAAVESAGVSGTAAAAEAVARGLGSGGAQASAGSVSAAAQRRSSPPLDPAAAALLREFRQRELCNQAMMLRANLSGTQGNEYLAMISARNVEPALRATFLENTRKMLDALDRVEPQCAALGDKLMDGSSYELALRAAEAGDREAASCFIGGAFPMPPALHERPEVLARFRLDALRLMERGIAQGDWRMVRMAQFVYAMKGPEWRPPSFEGPYFEPGLLLAATVGPVGGDAQQYYRMTRLLQLGVRDPDEAHNLAVEAADAARHLTAERRRAADAWAQAAFARQFQRRLVREDELVFPCGEDLLTPPEAASG